MNNYSFLASGYLDPGQDLFDTLIVFLTRFLKKVSRLQQNHEKVPSM